MFISTRYSRHCRRLIGLGVALLSVVAQAPAAGTQAAADTAALDSLRAGNASLSAAVDSMRQDLRDHRYAENFVNDALEEQGNRFALIVMIALGLTALLTVSGFLWEVNRAKQEVRDLLEMQKRENAALQAQLAETQRLNTTAMEARLAESDVSLHRAAGNAYVAIATIYEESSPGLAVAAWLLAAGNFYAFQVDPGLGFKILRHAREVLVQGAGQDRAQMCAQLKESEGLWRDAFRLLGRWGGPETEDDVPSIHARVLDLLGDPSEPKASGAAGRLTGRALP